MNSCAAKTIQTKATQLRKDARPTGNGGTAYGAEECATLQDRYDIRRDIIDTALLSRTFSRTNSELDLEIFRLDDATSDTTSREIADGTLSAFQDGIRTCHSQTGQFPSKR